MQERINRPNLYTAIQEILRDKILSGELKVGDKISEEKWCETLGVSRTPLKMSIVGLAEEGLVRTVPRRGAFVKELSVEDGLEIYQIREALESLAITLAIERGDQEQAGRLLETAKRYDEVYRIFRAMPGPERGGIRGDGLFFRMMSEDIAFHRTILSMGGNRHLFDLMNKGRFQQFTLNASERMRPHSELPAEIAEEHLSIAHAIIAGDAAEAKRVMHVHLARGVDALRRELACPADGEKARSASAPDIKTSGGIR
jgi:DNA-binding GntR family transcriptional regulator